MLSVILWVSFGLAITAGAIAYLWARLQPYPNAQALFGLGLVSSPFFLLGGFVPGVVALGFAASLVLIAMIAGDRSAERARHDRLAAQHAEAVSRRRHEANHARAKAALPGHFSEIEVLARPGWACGISAAGRCDRLGLLFAPDVIVRRDGLPSLTFYRSERVRSIEWRTFEIREQREREAARLRKSRVEAEEKRVLLEFRQGQERASAVLRDQVLARQRVVELKLLPK